MQFSIATWNINSVRLRIDLVTRFLDEHRPDVLCLQETKSPDEFFPTASSSNLAIRHAFDGKKGYHGVAIVSRKPLAPANTVRDFCGKDDCRHVRRPLAAGDGTEIHFSTSRPAATIPTPS